MKSGLSVVVLREGTEGLPMKDYVDLLRDRLPNHDIRHAKTPSQERSLVEKAEVITGVGIDESLLDRAERLELFSCVFAGTDHLPWDLLEKRDIIVTNASGIHVPGIAEHAIGLLLIFVRHLDEGMKRQSMAEWRHFQSDELAGSTVMIVGLGSIGKAIAHRLDGFDVHTIGVRYNPQKGGPTDEVIGYETEEFHSALAETEYLLIACPLTETTKRLIDADALKTLPPDVVIVNVARGGIIDTDALVNAIQENQIRGVGLDVTDPEPLPTDHPLWRFENVLITPHTGGHNPNHWDRMANILAENIRILESEGSNKELRNVIGY